jgi:2-phosphosulfolactate phosphatase
MEIKIESLIEGAKRANGLTVIIDVYRAATTAAFIFNNGADEIIPVKEVEEAFRLKEQNPDYILMGERECIKVDGFDFGNSPFLIKDINFKGKTIIMTTSAGTQGIFNAKDADDLLFGSFVNVGATINYIKHQNPEIVTLVAMGESGQKKSDEDELCAKYIKESLEGNAPNFDEIIEFLKDYKSSKKFLNDSHPDLPKGDFYCAMQLNKFEFIMKINRHNEHLSIIKEHIKNLSLQ